MKFLSYKLQVTSYKFLNSLLLLLIVSFSLFAFSAYAIDPLLPACDPVPGRQQIPTGGGPPLPTCGVKHLLQLVINVYNWMLYFAAMVALLIIIFGGIRMLLYSYWEQPQAELENAKYTVTRAITGLVVIIAAYLIVNTVVIFLTGDAGGINSLISPLFGP